MKTYLSPKGFLIRAALLVAAFLVLHALGWREHTAFISGTPANARLGVIYLFLWFLAVLVAPALAIAALVLAGLNRLVPVENDDAR